MEVAGFARRKVPASNLLGYFLDPQEPHGFGDLWFRSLMEAAALVGRAEAGFHALDPVERVERERGTARGNRIDLLIHSRGAVVGLENKLYAFLCNDLADYARTIEVDAAVEGRRPIGHVLAPRDATAEVAGTGFSAVSYGALFRRVRENVAVEGDWQGKWAVFAQDFTDTIDEAEAPVDDGLSRFYHEYWDKGSCFFEASVGLRRRHLERCRTIARIVDERGAVSGESRAHQWGATERHCHPRFPAV